MTPFRRDGHLSDLGIDYTLQGKSLPGTDGHLGDCVSCSRRLVAAGQVGRVPQAAANRAWVFGGLALAAAASLFLLPATVGVDDGMRVKGAGLHLEVFLDAGTHSRRLANGDVVAPGDRVGFRVRHEAGHLMILGVDAAHEPYLCYPQREGGLAASVGQRSEPQALPEAIRMDQTRGAERIVAVFCDQPFEFEYVAPYVGEGKTPAGCATQDLTLEKP